jgi:hypothetical protein
VLPFVTSCEDLTIDVNFFECRSIEEATELTHEASVEFIVVFILHTIDQVKVIGKEPRA